MIENGQSSKAYMKIYENTVLFNCSVNFSLTWIENRPKIINVTNSTAFDIELEQKINYYQVSNHSLTPKMSQDEYESARILVIDKKLVYFINICNCVTDSTVLGQVSYLLN